jgi:hypothetical protein
MNINQYLIQIIAHLCVSLTQPRGNECALKCQNVHCDSGYMMMCCYATHSSMPCHYMILKHTFLMLCAASRADDLMILYTNMLRSYCAAISLIPFYQFFRQDMSV